MWLQSSKKSSADAEIEGPPLLKYNGKDGRFKDEKDLKVSIMLNSHVFIRKSVKTLCIALLKPLVTAIFSLFFLLFKVLKWNFTAPRAEFVEQLKEQMRPCFGKTLHTNLFHADFKYHLIGINTMQQVLERHNVNLH